MVDLRAKWGNILYEEALRDVANVSLPETTMEEIMSKDISTPDIPITTAKLSLPPIVEQTGIETIIDLAKAPLTVIFGSREDKVKAVSGFIPADIETKTTTLPDYDIDILTKPIDIQDLGNVNIPSIDYPSNITYTPEGWVENLKPEDITTTTETQDFDKYIQEMIDIQKETIEGAREFWEQGVLGTSDIEVNMPSITFPDLDLLGGLKDIGKWILLGGGVLAGVYLLGKVIGGKK